MKNIVSAIAISVMIVTGVASCRPSAVVVKERPPVPFYTRPAPARPGYVWVEGGYVRSGRGYVYQQGYWAPPRQGRTYRQGYWKNTRRGYVWVPGRW